MHGAKIMTISDCTCIGKVVPSQADLEHRLDRLQQGKCFI